jgi:acetyltransferase-like isoleucine patch superfamily enzyme
MKPFSRTLYRIINKVLLQASEAESNEMIAGFLGINKSARIYPGARLENYCTSPSSIVINNRSHIRGRLVTMPPQGAISIGEDCYVGEGTNMWSCKSIVIGNRVLIAHNVNIHDSNAHPLDAGLRGDHFRHICSSGFSGFEYDSITSDRIIIEDDVWIGFNAIILKGVTIGKCAIVGAGAVVTKNVEPGTMVAGNPAIVVRKPLGQIQ